LALTVTVFIFDGARERRNFGYITLSKNLFNRYKSTYFYKLLLLSL